MQEPANRIVTSARRPRQARPGQESNYVIHPRAGTRRSRRAGRGRVASKRRGRGESRKNADALKNLKISASLESHGQRRRRDPLKAPLSEGYK